MTKRLTEALTAEITSVSGKALQPLLEHEACQVVEWSGVSAQDLVERELDRRKPVLEKSGQSIGLRDTIIWHGLLELLDELDENDFVIFVSADGAYVSGNELHTILEEEIEGSWFSSKHLRIATSLASAILEVKHLANLIGARDSTLSSALIGYIEQLDGMEWGLFPRGLNMTYGGASLPHGMEDAMLDSVDGVEIDHIGEGNPAECIGYADFTFSGRMTPSDFMDADRSTVDMTGGDVNGYEVTVEFTARAMIVAEIEFDLEPLYAEVVGASVSW